MQNYVIACAICRLMLDKVYYDENDLKLLAIIEAHFTDDETRGHKMDIIPINSGIKPEHFIELPMYKEKGYKLAEIL